MSIADNEAIVRRFLHEAWNRRDITALAALVSPDFLGHPTLVLPEAMTGLLPDAPVHGPTGLISTLLPWYTGFPQGEMTVDDLFVEGDRVVTRHTLRGTHGGPFWGIARTGRAVTLPMISIRRLDAGRIAEEWQIFDAMLLFQQLGVLPGAEDLPIAPAASDPPAPQGLILPPAENKAVLRRYYDEAVNGGQWAVLRELIAPTFVELSAGEAQPFSVDDLQQILRDWEIAFPTSHYAVEDEISAGDLATARLSWHAVHGGPFQGLPATGRPIALTQMAIVRISDGLITERWSILDRFGLLIQLGIISVSGPDKQTKPPGGRPDQGGGPERWSKDPGK